MQDKHPNMFDIVLLIPHVRGPVCQFGIHEVYRTHLWGKSLISSTCDCCICLVLSSRTRDDKSRLITACCLIFQSPYTKSFNSIILCQLLAMFLYQLVNFKKIYINIDVFQYHHLVLKNSQMVLYRKICKNFQRFSFNFGNFNASKLKHILRFKCLVSA